MKLALHEILSRSNAGQPISQRLAKDAMYELLTTDSESQRSALLGVLLSVQHSVLTEDVVVGYIEAISLYEGRDIISNKKKLSVPDGKLLIGLAGSGKKGVKTVNITTPAMVIATAIGTYCAKAGSRSTSSLMGSVDFVEALGIKVLTTFEQQEKLFTKTGFGFFPIEETIVKFDEHYGNRFIAPHALSLALPAVVLPVEVDSLMYGYAAPNIHLSARALLKLGYKDSFIVSNTDNMIHYVDEMLPTGLTSVVGVVDGVIGRSRSFDAAKFVDAINAYEYGTLAQRMTTEEQVEVLTAVLKGEMPNSEIENALCITAGTIAYIAHDVDNPKVGFQKAQASVRSGEVWKHLQKIIKESHRA